MSWLHLSPDQIRWDSARYQLILSFILQDLSNWWDLVILDIGSDQIFRLHLIGLPCSLTAQPLWQSCTIL